jgi:hypothetical protein
VRSYLSANPDSSPVEEQNPARKGMRKNQVHKYGVVVFLLLRSDQPPSTRQ